MIPIAPDGQVLILENIPFDREHVHTCLFANKAAQESYMSSKIKTRLDAVSYTRATGNSIKVQVKIENLYNCNYMAFKNTAFENKWFYAFIDDVTYINNITCEIFFTIDTMQTWMFDYALGQCFVEREHAVSDAIGSNLVPEQLETGDYVTAFQRSLPWFENVGYVVWATVNYKYNDYKGGTIGNLYSGLCPIWFDDEAGVSTWLEGLGAKADAVVAVIPFPRVFFSLPNTTPTIALKQTEYIPKSMFYLDFEGYTPRNKKLYTAPYNTCYITNFNGDATSYPLEYFADDEVGLTYACDISPSPKTAVMPLNYKGSNGENWDEKLYIGTYPQLSFNTDAFKQWLALNGVSLAVNTVGNITGVGQVSQGVSDIRQGSQQIEMANRGLATKGYGHGFAAMRSAGLATKGAGAAGIALGVVSALTSIGGAVATVYEHSLVPPQNKGSWGDSFLNAYKKAGGAVCRKHIRAEFARIIDEYFDMFGYATHRVKTPNTNSRPHWNYVKTRYCMLSGDLPESAESEIRDIFNRGITFWKTPSEIGDYSLDNSPT